MMPYETIHDAEAALNRSLTYAETLWFNYSANKSDCFLYCHNLLLFFIVYTLAPLPFFFMELFCSSKLDRYKIQPKVHISCSEMFACYKTVMKRLFIVVGPLQYFASYPSIKVIGIRTGLALPTRWEMIAQLVVYVLIEDYTGYWFHRLLHCEWGYQNIHNVHHEYNSPVAFSATYAHWAEIIILGIPSFLGPALVPGHIITFWFWFVLRQIEALEIHSGYDFPWTLTKYIPFYGGAEYHDYHHYVGGLSQSNFASVFTYCDYIYGTDKGYRYQKNLLNKNELTNSGESQNGKFD